MIDPMTLLTFVPAALALNLTPGADMVFCLGQGVRGGRRSAWLASAGVALGVVAHAVLAGTGVATLFAAIPWSFDAIRVCGIAYLLWLAFQMLGKPHVQGKDGGLGSEDGAFRSALIVNLTNPKVALFVLAFVPQFVSPGAGPVFLQFLVFGGVLAIGGFLINGLVGHFASQLSGRLTRRSRLFDYLCAGIFLVLAARLALLERI